MNQYSIQLEKYDGRESRFTCPSCGKARKLTRYIDILTTEYIAPNVGRCDRVDQCGYHYSPRQYFEDNKINLSDEQKAIRYEALKKLPEPRSMEPTYIHIDNVRSSLRGATQSDLITFLYSVFDNNRVNEVVVKYLIGQYPKWNKINPVFWQIDESGKIRSGKIIGYNPSTGKRIKKPYSQITWVHSVLKLKPFNLSQCLFGLHLLDKEPQKICGILESEKSALIASIVFPDILWIATGSVQNIKADIMKPLAKRKVVLYPDLGAYDLWSAKADELSDLIPDITVSDLLNRAASLDHKKGGYDLADYILADYQSKCH